jgi:hypothetical protein
MRNSVVNEKSQFGEIEWETFRLLTTRTHLDFRIPKDESAGRIDARASLVGETVELAVKKFKLTDHRQAVRAAPAGTVSFSI